MRRRNNGPPRPCFKLQAWKFSCAEIADKPRAHLLISRILDEGEKRSVTGRAESESEGKEAAGASNDAIKRDFAGYPNVATGTDDVT